jgi:hypothetical protein
MEIGSVTGSKNLTDLKCSAANIVSLAFVGMTTVVYSTRFEKRYI